MTLSFFLVAQKRAYDVRYQRLRELTPEAFKWMTQSRRPLMAGYVLGAFANFHRQVSLLGVGFVVFLAVLWRAHWLLTIFVAFAYFVLAELPVLRLYAARRNWEP